MTAVGLARNPEALVLLDAVDPCERYLHLSEWLMAWLRKQRIADPEGLLWPVAPLPRAQEETLQRVQTQRPISEVERAELLDTFMGMEAQIQRMLHARAPAEVADDLTGEVLTRALDRQHRFDPERGTYARWLWGIARLVLREFWSRRKGRPAGGEDPDSLPALPSAAREGGRALRDMGPVVGEFFEVIEAMPEEQRAIYVAVDIEGCPPAEFADALGWKRNSASSRLRLARERMLEARTRWQKRGLL